MWKKGGQIEGRKGEREGADGAGFVLDGNSVVAAGVTSLASL